MVTRSLEDRTRSARIRDWANENGFTIPPRGRIPKGVVSAFEAANPGDAVDDGAPDWDAAVSGLNGGDDPDVLAGLEDELANPEPEVEGEVPPTSLDEARARLGGQKQRMPGWARTKAKADDKPPPKITKATVSDIEGKLALLLAPPAAFWQMTDPLCGGAFADNLDNIVRKTVPLLVQSPTIVGWFTKGTTFLLWFDLVLALKPVGEAVYAHHVAGTVMLNERGEAVPSKRLDDGRVVPLKQAPSAQAEDWSAYTTQVPGHVPPVHAAS